ncbi:proton-associated sugar transporter A [Contarinia nasturtii]|uniref:proton-associated sugar transporter A n=1 Tax=Contarinia nasturtii TaxID=265458 RepID=UPI0012D48D97|nr:proton-associated sugar transporter A [Contarinia nasturtii]
MEKLHSYQGWIGRFHEWRESFRERFSNWRQENPETIIELVKKKVYDESSTSHGHADYSHLYRTKTRSELLRVSAAVMGIEFSYAAETAFVSPTLLSIGVQHQHMTLVWALSPLVGFFLTPIMGSLSDRCRLNLGRRRPFIILFSIGIFIGLLMVPNGEDLGYAMGDFNPYAVSNETMIKKTSILAHRSTASETEIINVANTSHPWGVFFTIIGTVLLDFDADACQSPSRAFLLDVTVPSDHAKGLSTFTIMAGLGGFMGYSLGAINWEETSLGVMLGGHVRAVFTLVTVIFIVCVIVTLDSFREIPLWRLESESQSVVVIDDCDDGDEAKTNEQSDEQSALNKQLQAPDPINRTTSYGALANDSLEIPKNGNQRRYTMPAIRPNTESVCSANVRHDEAETSFTGENLNQTTTLPIGQEEPVASFDKYLMSIIFMPHSLRMVCLTNLFCWMAHVCYSLYFTDFVGEAVFLGDPKAAEGTESYALYEEGVRFGCWGMAMYSLSCACYSTIIERLIRRFGAKKVYIGGLLFYSCGMCMMAMTKAPASVIIFSWCAGVMYSTLFTMPYLLVAHYHSEGCFAVDAQSTSQGAQIRGLGTDIAIVSSMVFLAQFILSMCMGTIVTWSGTTTAVVSMASFLSFCGAICATQVMYLDL